MFSEINYLRFARLRWYGSCENGMMAILTGKRKQEKPKTRYLDVAKEDMQEVGAREDEVFDRSVWKIQCGDL